MGVWVTNFFKLLFVCVCVCFFFARRYFDWPIPKKIKGTFFDI
jgi:hypothetical protein